jgi:ABC-2 type transport system ATP-binding protein
MAALDVRGVTKAYDTKVAVDGVSLTVEPGEVFGLLGPNGAGKSSLIRMIMDIIRPDSGEIRVLGAPVSPSVKEKVGYLPEERGLYQRQHVGEVLRFLGELKGLPRHVADRRVENYLDRVGLLDVRKKKMRELSKGMQQKVQIVGVLLTEPELIILDEPFEGLDPVNRVLVNDLLKEFSARGTAIVLSSHRMDQVEAMCRQVLLIDRGKAVLSGSVDKIKESHADNAVFLESEPDASARPEVERAQPAGRGHKLWLKPGVGPEPFLSRLVGEGVRIRRFERALPSLDEVFVRVVGRRPEGPGS